MSGRALAGASVLIVDDDVDLRLMLADVLQSRGLQVRTCGSGPEALALVRERQSDLVIVDYDMPKMNGVTLLRQLADLAPMMSRLLLTGRLERDIVMAAVNSGRIVRAMQKPVSQAALLEAVTEAWEHSERLRRASGEQAEREAAVATAAEGQRIVRCISESTRLVLQPIVSAADHEPVAHEALLRSSNAEFPGPLELLDGIDRHGLGLQLSDRVIRLASECIGRLPDEGLLFVNLHADDLLQPAAVAERFAPLARWASRIVLEITERAALDTEGVWQRSVAELENMGFALALDDVGAGYHSFSALAGVAPQYLKADVSLIRDVHLERQKAKLVGLLVKFAHATDCKVIAEGIEANEEAVVLRDLGVDLMQGFLFGRPADQPARYRQRLLVHDFSDSRTDA